MQICVMIHHVRVAPKYRPTWPQGTREADHPRAMNASTTVSITTHHIHDPANCTYYPARARAPRCDPRRPLLRLTERLVVLGPRTCSRLNWHVRTGRERVNRHNIRRHVAGVASNKLILRRILPAPLIVAADGSPPQINPGLNP